MTLEQIKKEIMELAIRYDSKDYFYATYETGCFSDGYGKINNIESFDITFCEHLQRCMPIISNLKCVDLEAKAVLKHIMEYVKQDSSLHEIEIVILNGRIKVRVTKLVKEELD